MTTMVTQLTTLFLSERGGVRQGPDGQKYSLPIELTEPVYRRLLKIQQMAGLDSIGATIRQALRLYEWYLQCKRDGHKILVNRNGILSEIDLGSR